MCFYVSALSDVKLPELLTIKIDLNNIDVFIKFDEKEFVVDLEHFDVDTVVTISNMFPNIRKLDITCDECYSFCGISGYKNVRYLSTNIFDECIQDYIINNKNLSVVKIFADYASLEYPVFPKHVKIVIIKNAEFIFNHIENISETYKYSRIILDFDIDDYLYEVYDSGEIIDVLDIRDVVKKHNAKLNTTKNKFMALKQFKNIKHYGPGSASQSVKIDQVSEKGEWKETIPKNVDWCRDYRIIDLRKCLNKVMIYLDNSLQIEINRYIISKYSYKYKLNIGGETKHLTPKVYAGKIVQRIQKYDLCHVIMVFKLKKCLLECMSDERLKGGGGGGGGKL